MFWPYKWITMFTVGLAISSAEAASVYVVNGSQFGTVDLSTGTFNQIGPDTPGTAGLVQGSGGSLLTLSFAGELDSINPVTGATSVIGATGLADCSTPASPCGPTSASTIGQLGGTIYATDLSNHLYTVDPSSGRATLTGATGIPAVPFVLGASNPDGSFNAYDEALFSAGGKLYATFDAITVNPATETATSVVSPALYQINPETGLATLIGPTAPTLGAAVDIDGTVYAFNDSAGQVVTLDLTNGDTSVVTNFDPAAGIVDGAAATPEPVSTALVGVGIAAIGLCRLRRRHGSPKGDGSSLGQ